jgi:hypothetical protein
MRDFRDGLAMASEDCLNTHARLAALAYTANRRRVNDIERGSAWFQTWGINRRQMPSWIYPLRRNKYTACRSESE